MQSASRIIEDCACHRVRMAARTVTRLYDEVLRPTGLRATQLIVLVAASAKESLSISALADFLGMDRTTLTRNLRPLEQDGLITIGAEGWKRSRTIGISEAGRERLRDAFPYWEKAQTALRRQLGSEDFSRVRSVLDDLILGAETLSPENRPN